MALLADSTNAERLLDAFEKVDPAFDRVFREAKRGDHRRHLSRLRSISRMQQVINAASYHRKVAFVGSA